MFLWATGMARIWETHLEGGFYNMRLHPIWGVGEDLSTLRVTGAVHWIPQFPARSVGFATYE
ncbi:hypothetical protein SBA4_6360005 [Candidatus Sulfopaludibacter sp. SbA4]|nr:hypothetical protein SBA4_6360005 [Candidatus Sulfopaludibacter sp. SbA4]